LDSGSAKATILAVGKWLAAHPALARAAHDE
jgi:peptidoglycan/xylan/chitin deacetylase (PgdA/CDA1 family)